MGDRIEARRMGGKWKIIVSDKADCARWIIINPLSVVYEWTPIQWIDGDNIIPAIVEVDCGDYDKILKEQDTNGYRGAYYVGFLPEVPCEKCGRPTRKALCDTCGKGKTPQTHKLLKNERAERKD